MHTIMTLSPLNLNKNDVRNWLKNNFETSDLGSSTVLSCNDMLATFYHNNLEFDSPTFSYDEITDYEIIMYDLEKSKEFEKIWDWWITEKWYAFDALFADFDSMREWCCKNIKMSEWKINGQCFTFKKLEDFNLFAAEFGEEYHDDFDSWSRDTDGTLD